VRSESTAFEPSPLLRVRDLRVRFDEREVVHGISFEVRAGETLGLVGESGSGKSVASLALMQLLAPTAKVSGSALFTAGDAAPVNLLMLSEQAMRQRRGRALGMVFQDPMTALNPVMPVGRQVAEAVMAHQPRAWGWSARRELQLQARQRALAAMREVSLPDPERRYGDYPHQFSGGQRQRLLIAMATVNRPQLLIADEPTTALDVTVQAKVLALLRRLRDDLGLAMLFISHDLAVVASVADRVAVMQQGEIVETGSCAEIFANPRHPYTRRLLASAPTMQSDRSEPLAQVAAPPVTGS
jgi:peptide/nickel transport system ATP-binding protein